MVQDCENVAESRQKPQCRQTFQTIPVRHCRYFALHSETLNSACSPLSPFRPSFQRHEQCLFAIVAVWPFILKHQQCLFAIVAVSPFIPKHRIVLVCHCRRFALRSETPNSACSPLSPFSHSL